MGVFSISVTPRKEPVSRTAKEEMEALADRNATSTQSDVRYLAYASRLRTAFVAAQRYIAYTSDVGEAFRPVISPWVVRTAYGISWAYLAGDVAFETWKAKRHGPSILEAAHFSEEARLGLVAAKRMMFQAVASMALPAFTIHTIVRQSGRLFKSTVNPRVRLWGPTFTGLAVVPILPYIFDYPVEKATDSVFEWLEHRWYERITTEKLRRHGVDAKLKRGEPKK